MKRIVLTGGGTAGHVSPNQALIPHLLEEGWDIHYIGTKNGIERTLIEPMQGVTYHAVSSGKLRRYFDWKNFTDPFRVIAGAFQSIGVIGRLKPNVVFSKGGFVSVPVVFGAAICGVPVVMHESDITPGLANKLCKPFAKSVCTTFPECAKLLAPKGVLTGTPLRAQIFSGDRARGLRLAGFDGQKPVLMMIGGSLGAQTVNAVLREALPALTKRFDVLHVCGKGNLDASLENTPGYKQFEYLSDELPDAFACADIMLSRAGSNSLSELMALCKPALLIPYHSGRGDQVLNANSLKARGLAHVMPQSELTAESLPPAIDALWADRELLHQRLAALLCQLVHRLVFLQKRAHHVRAADAPARQQIGRRRGFRNLPFKRGLVHVDPDAHHHVVDALLVRVHLQQHAADLFAPADDVVGPLDARVHLAHAGNRARHGQRRLQREPRHMGGVRLRPQNQGHKNALARRGNPAPAASAAPRRLLVGHDERTLRRAVRGQRAGVAVGRIHAAQIHDAPPRPPGFQAARDHRRHQAVRYGREPITLPAAGLNVKPRLAKLADLLPNRRAGHAQLLAERLAGNRLAPEQPRQNFFCHHSLSPSLPGASVTAARRIACAAFISFLF